MFLSVDNNEYFPYEKLVRIKKEADNITLTYRFDTMIEFSRAYADAAARNAKLVEIRDNSQDPVYQCNL